MSATDIRLTKISGALPDALHREFYDAVIDRASDRELAHRFGLSERTAANYRKAAEDLARMNGVDLPDRFPGRRPGQTKKGPEASDLRPLDTQPES